MYFDKRNNKLNMQVIWLCILNFTKRNINFENSELDFNKLDSVIILS